MKTEGVGARNVIKMQRERRRDEENQRKTFLKGGGNETKRTGVAELAN